MITKKQNYHTQQSTYHMWLCALPLDEHTCVCAQKYCAHVCVLLSTALTTCRDGWLGFPFRWRTQQSAISGINCRITLLPNLWTQKAPGRSSLQVNPVHAISLSVEQTTKYTNTRVLAFLGWRKSTQPSGYLDKFVIKCLSHKWVTRKTNTNKETRGKSSLSPTSLCLD